jgi:hypothetical protein
LQTWVVWGKAAAFYRFELPTESAEWFIDPTTDRYPTKHRFISRFLIAALPLPGLVVVHSEVPANLLIHLGSNSAPDSEWALTLLRVPPDFDSAIRTLGLPAHLIVAASLHSDRAKLHSNLSALETGTCRNAPLIKAACRRLSNHRVQAGGPRDDVRCGRRGRFRRCDRRRRLWPAPVVACVLRRAAVRLGGTLI